MKIITIILILISETIYAQTLPDTLYQVEITATASSLFSYFNQERYPRSNKHMVCGFGFFVRCMWHPARLLSVGIMTGYSQIANDDFLDSDGKKASARLSAIPIQIAVSMQSKNFEFGLGMGPYLMMSSIYYGKTARGKRYELGLTFFSSYLFSFNNNIRLGPELRTLYLSYRGIISVIPSLFIRFEILRY